jgi:hypothetical protein
MVHAQNPRRGRHRVDPNGADAPLSVSPALVDSLHSHRSLRGPIGLGSLLASSRSNRSTAGEGGPTPEFLGYPKRPSEPSRRQRLVSLPRRLALAALQRARRLRPTLLPTPLRLRARLEFRPGRASRSTEEAREFRESESSAKTQQGRRVFLRRAAEAALGPGHGAVPPKLPEGQPDLSLVLKTNSDVASLRPAGHSDNQHSLAGLLALEYRLVVRPSGPNSEGKPNRVQSSESLEFWNIEEPQVERNISDGGNRYVSIQPELDVLSPFTAWAEPLCRVEDLDAHSLDPGPACPSKGPPTGV